MDTAIRELVDVHGPFVSVYLPPNTSVLAWQTLRGQLVAQWLDDRTLDALDEATEEDAPSEGRALIVAEGVVLVDEVPSWSPPEPLARLSDLPYLLPLAPRHSVRKPTGALVAAGAGDPVPAERDVFDQFLFEWSRADGPALDGLHLCTEMLREGLADALVISPGQLGDQTVWVGGTHRDQVADETALRATGMAVNQQRADEALPMAALAVDAEILVAPDDLPLADGVGVLFRNP